MVGGERPLLPEILGQPAPVGRAHFHFYLTYKMHCHVKIESKSHQQFLSLTTRPYSYPKMYENSSQVKTSWSNLMKNDHFTLTHSLVAARYINLWISDPHF